jgi:hypothetical protein
MTAEPASGERASAKRGPGRGRSRPGSLRRLRWAGLLWRASRREGKGDFEAALAALEAADRLEPLWPAERVQRAWLLLRAQRLREAQRAFAALWKEWEGAEDPDRQYLRRFCNAMLGMIRVDPGPMHYEARAARDIPCRPRLRRRFVLVGDEED